MVYSVRAPKMAWPIVLGVVAIVGAFSFVLDRRYDASLAAVHESFARRQALDATLSLLKDAETGQRGFILNGDQQFLVPYTFAAEHLGARFAGARGRGKGRRCRVSQRPGDHARRTRQDERARGDHRPAAAGPYRGGDGDRARGSRAPPDGSDPRRGDAHARARGHAPARTRAGGGRGPAPADHHRRRHLGAVLPLGDDCAWRRDPRDAPRPPRVRTTQTKRGSAARRGRQRERSGSHDRRGWATGVREPVLRADAGLFARGDDGDAGAGSASRGGARERPEDDHGSAGRPGRDRTVRS
jgi:CHASE3 domain